MKYLFETTVTMKEYNRKKWWIDADIIPRIRIEAENMKAALKAFQKEVYKRAYIEVSDNALKTKNDMYIDTISGETKQVGYVITGKTEFEDRNNYRYSTQYIDLWVNICTIQDADFEE